MRTEVDVRLTETTHRAGDLLESAREARGRWVEERTKRLHVRFCLVGRVGIEPTTNGLKVLPIPCPDLFFYYLPGRPLQLMHDSARRCGTDLRKTYASRL